MGLYKVEYRLRDGALPDYIADMISKNACPSVIPSSCYYFGKTLVINCDTSGLSSFYTQIGDCECRMPFRVMLMRIMSALEALQTAADYLIPSEYLSLSLKDIFFRPDGKALVQVRPSGKTAFEHARSLCCEISVSFPECNADLVQRRLSALCSGSADPGCASMLRLLSSWIFELRSGA